jgi:hypothetical protein
VHAYELRSRKIQRTETDPNRRCTIVKGWPADKGQHKPLAIEATGASAPLLEGDAVNFDSVEGPTSGEKLPLQENPPPELPPANDGGMIRDESSDSVSSDGEPQVGGRSRRMLDKLRAKKDADYERQHAEFIKKQNVEQARLLRKETDRLNERRIKMANESFEGKNTWRNVGPISNKA